MVITTLRASCRRAARRDGLVASCEYCWNRSGYPFHDEYGAVLRRAEAEGWPCTKNTEEGARLRAGQFWDEATKRDTRDDSRDARPTPTPEGSPDDTE